MNELMNEYFFLDHLEVFYFTYETQESADEEALRAEKSKALALIVNVGRHGPFDVEERVENFAALQLKPHVVDGRRNTFLIV